MSQTQLRTFCSVATTAWSYWPPTPRSGGAAALVSVAIRGSDTGLIGALLNLTGREETLRRTPGCLRVSRRGKAHGRADSAPSEDHIYYSFTAWISAQAWQEGTKTFHYKIEANRIERPRSECTFICVLHISSKLCLGLLVTWAADCYYVTDSRRTHARGDSFTLPSEEWSPKQRRMFSVRPGRTDLLVGVITHWTIGKSPAACVFTRLSTAGATNGLFKTFVQKNSTLIPWGGK